MVNLEAVKEFYTFKLHKRENNAIEFSLKILDFIYCNPMNQTRGTYLFMNVFRLITILLIVLLLKNLSYVTEIEDFGSQLVGLMACMQVSKIRNRKEQLFFLCTIPWYRAAPKSCLFKIRQYRVKQIEQDALPIWLIWFYSVIVLIFIQTKLLHCIHVFTLSW